MGKVFVTKGVGVFFGPAADTDLIFEPVYPGPDGHGLDVPRLPVDAVVVTPWFAQRLIQPSLQLLKYNKIVHGVIYRDGNGCLTQEESQCCEG